MSTKVDLGELAGHLHSYGFAYLLTVGDDLRAHAVAVTPTLSGGHLTVEGLGRRTRSNLVSRPDVSLVWPPVAEGGYSLIVDARATVTVAGADLAPSRAVLHRPADHSATGEEMGGTGCGNDCVPIES